MRGSPGARRRGPRAACSCCTTSLRRTRRSWAGSSRHTWCSSRSRSARPRRSSRSSAGSCSRARAAPARRRGRAARDDLPPSRYVEVESEDEIGRLEGLLRRVLYPSRARQEPEGGAPQGASGGQR
jgi:hypothetical protein